MRMIRYMMVMLIAIAASAVAERPAISPQEATLLEEASGIAATNEIAALELIESARGRGRAAAPVDYSAANLLAALGRYEEAEQAYRIALDKAPNFAQAQIGLARVLALLGRWAEAEALLRSRVAKEDVPVEHLLLYGNVLLEMNRTVSAETIFRRAALLDGDSRGALAGLARCFLAQQRWTESAALAEELVTRYPDEASYWRLLADTQLAQGNRQAAVIALEGAWRMGAADASVLLLLGELHVAADRADEAARVLNAATEKVAERPEDWLRLAESLVWAGLLEQVEDLLRRYAAEVDERPTRYFRTQARLAEQRDDAEAVREAYANWVRHDPVNREALLALGDWHAEREEWHRAETWYERSAQAHANDAAPWSRLARSALAREAYAQAESHLTRAHVLGGEESVERLLQQVRRLRALQDQD